MELYRKQELLARRSAQHTLMSAGSAASGGAGGALSTAALQKADFGTLQRLWQSEGRALWAAKDPESVFQIVRDLVDFQVRFRLCASSKQTVISTLIVSLRLKDLII